MTLEDIAEKAGVSRSTVSRVINDDPRVSKETRARVWSVIEGEGFVPDPLARGMVTRRTQVIGVVIPTSLSAIFRDSAYFPTLLDGIAKVVHSRDYGMLLWIAQASEEEQLFQQRVLKNRLMDGMIIASATTVNQRPFIDHLLRLNTPFVMVERAVHRSDQVSYVTIDNLHASQDLVSHLVKLGYKRIATITGNLDNVDGQDRLKGYQKALEQAQIPYDSSLVVEGDFSSQSGYEGMKILLQLPCQVDAVFAATDLTAVGAFQAITEVGLSIPGDIALVGFDDLPHASHMTPQLTTVWHPIQKKGAQAAHVLLDLIDGTLASPQHIQLPTRLVIRDSCGAVKRQEVNYKTNGTSLV
ncbi:MAG: LacI family transcriptional regulator [Anaerolineae bacterium]|nr:LacI family transcriptional regulator [Anaerolineae bacterium]